MARLLVIEDNPANLELMTYLLHAYGHETITAIDGAAGLALAESEAVDLILCDVHLPKLDGYEVAQRLKAHPRLCRLPLVAVTALAMVGDRDKVLAAGFDGYIAKPLDPQNFVAEVDAFLGADLRSVFEPPSAESAPEAVSARKAHVLLVEERLGGHARAAAALTSAGYQVSLAVGLDQGLTLLVGESLDLVIADLHRPGADGFALLDALHGSSRLAGLPLLMIAAPLWDEHDRQRACARGATACLQSPTSPQDWLAAVTTYLAREECPDGKHPDR